jgi:hypothetical protein
MVHKLAASLNIDPTELFSKEVSPEIILKNSQKAAFENVGEAMSKFISDFISEKIRKLDVETED